MNRREYLNSSTKLASTIGLALISGCISSSSTLVEKSLDKGFHKHEINPNSKTEIETLVHTRFYGGFTIYQPSTGEIPDSTLLDTKSNKATLKEEKYYIAIGVTEPKTLEIKSNNSILGSSSHEVHDIDDMTEELSKLVSPNPARTEEPDTTYPKRDGVTGFEHPLYKYMYENIVTDVTEESERPSEYDEIIDRLTRGSALNDAHHIITQMLDSVVNILVHAIARYYGLNSEVTDIISEEVRNRVKDFISPRYHEPKVMSDLRVTFPVSFRFEINTNSSNKIDVVDGEKTYTTPSVDVTFYKDSLMPNEWQIEGREYEIVQKIENAVE